LNIKPYIATQFIDRVFSAPFKITNHRSSCSELVRRTGAQEPELSACFQKECLSLNIEFGRQFRYYYTLHYRSQRRRNSVPCSRPLQVRRL